MRAIWDMSRSTEYLLLKLTKCLKTFTQNLD